MRDVVNDILVGNVAGQPRQVLWIGSSYRQNHGDLILLVKRQFQRTEVELIGIGYEEDPDFMHRVPNATAAEAEGPVPALTEAAAREKLNKYRQKIEERKYAAHLRGIPELDALFSRAATLIIDPSKPQLTALRLKILASAIEKTLRAPADPTGKVDLSKVEAFLNRLEHERSIGAAGAN
jgi:hypothetical protein